MGGVRPRPETSDLSAAKDRDDLTGFKGIGVANEGPVDPASLPEPGGLPPVDQSAAKGRLAVRPMQTALLVEYERPVGPIPESLWIGDNAGLIASIAPLYLTGSVLDVTYGGGAWWKRYTPEPFSWHDLALDGVDFRSLPEDSDSWDAVCFDPPYLPSRAMETSTGRAVDHRAAYGLTERRSRAELDALIADGLAECARVARQWVLAKCCDYAQNPTVFTLGHLSTIVAGEAAGLRVHDLLVHGGNTGPVNTRLRTVRRARRAHSYLIVFRAKGAGLRAAS